MRVRALFFDMNSYFAAVAQQEEPALIGRPVGVITKRSRYAACIAASYEAKALGIGMGTTQAEAKQRCPNIVFREAKHDVCVAYHHRIRAAVDQVIPINQAHSVDEFSCILMGRQQELEQALRIAQDVQQVILRDVGPAMKSSIGVAPNPVLAKLAAEMKKPMGINWLHPDVMPAKIAHIPLSDIPGISGGMEPRLNAAGVTNTTQLYALAPKEARTIWGNVTGERFIRSLHGEWIEWPREHGKSLGHGQNLTGPNRTAKGARLVARRLLIKAAARLRRQDAFARFLHVRARCAFNGRQSHSGEITATQDTFDLLEVFDRYWREFKLVEPKSVSIMLGGLIPRSAHTRDLFDTRRLSGENTKRENLCRALDGLNRRFGQDTIRFGELPPYKLPYTGAKIAFHRVPDWEDFTE